MAGHEHKRAEEDRREHPPNHVDCNMFTTEKSRVVVHQLVDLMTPENIQVIERWLDRLKKAETSAWEVFVKTVKVGIVVIFATVLYHLTEAGFLAWIKKFMGK